MGASELRDLYLKTENYLGGEYFARMVKVSEPWASQALLGFPTASASREWGPAGAPVLFPFLNPCPSSSGEGQAPMPSAVALAAGFQVGRKCCVWTVLTAGKRKGRMSVPAQPSTARLAALRVRSLHWVQVRSVW